MTFIIKWFDSFQMFSKQTERKQSYALEYNSTLTPIIFKSEVDEQRNQNVEIFAKLKKVNQLSIPFKCHILNHYLLYYGKANHSWLTFMFIISSCLSPCPSRRPSTLPAFLLVATKGVVTITAKVQGDIPGRSTTWQRNIPSGKLSKGLFSIAILVYQSRCRKLKNRKHATLLWYIVAYLVQKSATYTCGSI